MSRFCIRGGLILDGSGGPPHQADLLLDDGIIAAVGSLPPDPGCDTLDASGLCVSPGFVDIHRHGDLLALRGVLGPAELPQGITTVVNGNCGMSAAPCPPESAALLHGYLRPVLGEPPPGAACTLYSDYAQRLRSIPLAVGVGGYIGCGTVRIAIKGFDTAPMTAGELERARDLVRDAMAAGAVGLSLGLMYTPERYMPRAELVALMGEAARAGGLVSAHIRGEGASLLASVREALDLAKESGAALNISHLKAAARESWGQTLRRAIDAMEDARAAGQDVTCDVYPYTAGATMLQTLLPPQYQGGGLALLRGAQHRESLRRQLACHHDDWDNLALSLGWEAAVVTAAHADDAACVGLSVAAIAARRGVDPVDCLCDLLLRSDGQAAMVLHSMSPDDMAMVLALSYSMVISDAIHPPAGLPHPRAYGAFPRALRLAGEGALPMEQMVRKMTAMPARRAGFADRGLLQPGLRADIVLFDGRAVGDRATYEDPAQAPSGIPWVFIGGRPAVAHGRIVNDQLGQYTERKGSTHGF